MTLRNSIEAVAEFLGGPVEAMPLKRNGAYASIVMFSRVADLDAAERNPARSGPIPGPSILCSVKGNDLISLPPDRREAYLRSYERFGDMALTEEKLPPFPLPLFRAATPGRLPLIILTNVKNGKGGKKK